MTQEALHATQVGAVIEEVGGKRVSQRVRRQGRTNPGGSGMPFQTLPGVLARHRRAALREKHRVFGSPSQQIRARLAQVASEPFASPLSNGNQSVLAALPLNLHDAAPQVDARQGQVHQLTHAQAAGIHDLQHGAVAQAQGASGVGGIKQSLDLRLGERARQPLTETRGVQARAGVIGTLPFAVQPSVKLSQAGQPSRLGAGAVLHRLLREPLLQIQFGGTRQGRRGRLQVASDQAEITCVAVLSVGTDPSLQPQRIGEAVDDGKGFRREGRRFRVSAVGTWHAAYDTAPSLPHASVRTLVYLLSLIYALIATPVFCVLMFGVFCPLILMLPTLAARRALGRASVRICLAAIGVPLRVRGQVNLPDHATIVVANHTSYMDGLVLTAALPGRFTFIVQDGAARWPLVGAVIRRMGVSFVNRDSARAGARQTRQLLKQLHSGTSLAIFAEGTFPDQPGLLPFKTGAFLLAARANVPVTPAVIRGTRTLLGGGWWGFRWSPVQVDLYPALMPMGADKSAAIVLRDAVRAVILDEGDDGDANGEEETA